jgi:predicted PurR-regulated permease PerM
MNERRALAWVAFGAVAVIAWLARPFATGLLLGALMGFALRPANDSLARRTGRPLLAALGVMIAATVIIVGALAGFVTIFITRAVALANTVKEQLAPGGAITGWVDAASRWLGRFGVPTESLPERLRAVAGEVASRSAGIAAAFASSTFGLFLGLLFAILAMYAVLRYWPQMVTAVIGVSPLRPDYTQALLEDFERVGRTTLSGTVITALAQGTLAAVGYSITGVPDSLFFGVATALASLVPAVGTLLVWIPVGVYLFATGHPTMAIVELLWGALVVVGVSDYVIRPRLVAESGTPALLTFVALFGGLEVMGLPGIIVGPIIMALAIAVLRLYAEEEQASRAASETMK